MSNPLAGVSADVATILGHEDRKQAQADLPKWKRNQMKRDARRLKVTVDFTGYEQLQAQLYALAEREHTGVSTMALWLLALGLERVRREGLTPRKRQARSLQHSYDVVIEDVGNVAL
ncbi:MAG TPA: hypothetical protein PLG06_08490 [Anaerolineae bacterium]|nr:hypothetical protein [Anaerolineae bacterium]